MRPGIVGRRYRIERPLGTGGMASVVLARDEELGRPVAIKLLADNLAGDPDFRARFVREARVAARLSHPNVVAVFDTGEEEGRPFIVMEYVEGETLAELLRRERRLSPALAVDLGRQAAAALAHAHAAEVVHRDVKPQNLLVRGDGVLKIADFGIARAAEATRLTQAGTVLGTAAYLAPEQAAGEEATAAADVYSLGAVLYELLTGSAPYPADSLTELARKQSSGHVVPVRDLAADVPPQLEETVMRCLARFAERRPSAGDLAADLAAADDDRPTVPIARGDELRPTRVLAARPSRGRGGRWPWILAAAAAVVVALGAVAVASPDDDPARPAPVRVDRIDRGATPADQARNLAEWLRRYSR